MNLITDIRNWILPLGLLLTGCVNVSDLTPPGEASEELPCVVLRIAVPADATRSNPTGGEEGDGREEGVLNEDEIRNINLFFYKDDNGLDAADNTQILYSIYYNLENTSDPANTTLKVEETNISDNIPQSIRYLDLKFSGKEVQTYLEENMNFATVVNTGKIEPKTMGELRNYTLTASAMSGTGTALDHFVMTTAYNQDEKLSGNISSGTNKLSKTDKNFKGITTVERLYARIDLWYNATDNAGISANADGTTGGFDNLCYSAGANNKVYICNVLPVNVMQKPSYMFKKVTETQTWTATNECWTASSMKDLTAFKWGGKELPDTKPTASPKDQPTNYVMEPTTLAKSTKLGENNANISSWYGTTATAKVKEAITKGETGKLSGYYNMPKTEQGRKPDRISIITYANENTHPTDCFNSDYLTGLAFRGIYVPATIYKKYYPGTTAGFETMTAEDKKAFGSGNKIYRYSPSTRKDQTEDICLYFAYSEDANAYKTNHPEDNAVITEYITEYLDENTLGFVCYYNLWLRHYNDEKADPQEAYPMEYATVRNNIYRVSISFNGPGDPEPTMREPDTMQARIFVRKWNLRTEDKPLEF